MYYYGRTSKSHLKTVKPELQSVAYLALEISPIDFGISEGLRAMERQRKLYEEKKSRTLKSYHLTGDALDIYAYLNGKAFYPEYPKVDLKAYYSIAEAWRQASRELGVPVIWGAVWKQPLADIRICLREAHMQYVERREQKGYSVFIDAPHFQLVR